MTGQAHLPSFKPLCYTATSVFSFSVQQQCIKFWMRLLTLIILPKKLEKKLCLKCWSSFSKIEHVLVKSIILDQWNITCYSAKPRSCKTESLFNFSCMDGAERPSVSCLYVSVHSDQEICYIFSLSEEIKPSAWYEYSILLSHVVQKVSTMSMSLTTYFCCLTHTLSQNVVEKDQQIINQ